MYDTVRDLYARRPDLYDLMHAEVVDDMRFLAERVQALGANADVLELGCGTGRLLTAMLDAGARVTGLDREPAMLEVARQRLAPFGARVTLVEGDMRRFALARRYDLVVVGLNTFMHLLTVSDQLDCLAGIHAHLRPAGILLLDLANPHVLARETSPGLMQHRFTAPAPARDGGSVTLWSVTSLMIADQIAHSDLFFDEVDRGGTLRRSSADVTLRLTYRFELELLLARSGFAVRSLYGDYEGEPYGDDSERMVCEAIALA